MVFFLAFMNVNRCWLNLDIRTCFGMEDVECVLEFWKGPWWIGNKPFVVVVVVAWSRDERIYSIPVFCLHPGIFSFAFWCVLCCVLLRRFKDVVSAVSCRCTVTCSEICESVPGSLGIGKGLFGFLVTWFRCLYAIVCGLPVFDAKAFTQILP